MELEKLGYAPYDEIQAEIMKSHDRGQEYAREQGQATDAGDMDAWQKANAKREAEAFYRKGLEFALARVFSQMMKDKNGRG